MGPYPGRMYEAGTELETVVVYTWDEDAARGFAAEKLGAELAEVTARPCPCSLCGAPASRWHNPTMTPRCTACEEGGQ